MHKKFLYKHAYKRALLILGALMATLQNAHSKQQNLTAPTGRAKMWLPNCDLDKNSGFSIGILVMLTFFEN